MAATNKELRQAFLEGQVALIEYWRQHPGVAYPMSTERWQMAEKRFPKEMKTQSRKVVVGRFTYWFEGQELWAQLNGGGTEQVPQPAGGGPKWWSLDDVRKLGELAANPTEEVEVEDS